MFYIGHVRTIKIEKKNNKQNIEISPIGSDKIVYYF